MPEPKEKCDAKELPSFEEALLELGEIVQELEEGQIGLSQALARYEEGVRLLKQCYGLLEHAERRIELLTGVDAAGNPVTEPFEETGGATLEEKSQARSRRRSKPPATGVRSEPQNDIDESPGLF